MANITIKAEEVIDAAEISLERAIVLPALFWTDITRDNYVGAKNDTVTLRLPAVVEATIRDLRDTSAVTFGEIEETSVPVTLSKQVIVPIKSSLVEQTLDLIPFAKRFVQPAIKGLARGVENVLASVLDAANPSDTVSWDGTADGVEDALLAAGTVFDTADVDPEGRFVVVGSAVNSKFIKYAMHLPQAAADVARPALTAATISSDLAGFKVVRSNAIDPHAIYAASPYAIAFTAFGPTIPAGAVDGDSGVQDGIGFSVIQDYDPVAQSDRLAVTSFVGATSVEIDDVNPFLVRIGDFS